MRRVSALVCCFAVALGVASTEARAGIITGTFAWVGDSDSDLTALGTADWAYWNTTSNPAAGGPTNRKSGVTALIGTISPVGGGSVRGSSSPTQNDFVFSDGAGPASGTIDNPSGLFNTQLNTNGAGVALNVTLPTIDEYVVYVWVAAYVANQGTLTATLPGVPNPTSFVNTELSEPGTTKRSALYTLHATPDTPGDTLGLSLVLTNSAGGNGHVLINGVATSVWVPPPPPPPFYAYDGFSYPTGNLAGRDEGTGWGAAWTGTGNAQVVALGAPLPPPLQYAIPGASLITGGASALQINGNDTPVAGRALEQTWSQDDVYASLLFRWAGGSPAGSDDFLVFRFGGNNGPQFGVKMNASGGTGFFVRMGETNKDDDYAGLVPVVGETYFLVAHLGKGAVGGGSDYDYLDLWINPSYDGSALATAHAEDIGNLISFSSFDLRSANLETGANGDVILLDELRLALTWDEALNYTYVPEPATMFLLAGGLLALARRRTSLKSRRR